MTEEAPEYEISPFEIAERTMLGDLMGLVVDELKSAQDVWQKLPQHQQQDTLYRIETRCKHAVQQVVNIIASNGQESVPAKLNKITIDKEIKAELHPFVHGESESLNHLTAAVKGTVHIVIPYDLANRVSDEGKPQAQPDQEPLGFEDDDTDDGADSEGDEPTDSDDTE